MIHLDYVPHEDDLEISEKWDIRGLNRAAENAGYSKDPSSQVGAVLMRPDRTFAGDGFNGFPKGLDDSPELYLDRDYKIATVIHAEENAVLNSRDHSLRGYTLYVSGLPPCCRCASKIIQKGIGRVVAHNRMVPARWAQNMRWAAANMLSVGIRIDLYDGELHAWKQVLSPDDYWFEETEEVAALPSQAALLPSQVAACGCAS